MEQFVNVEIKIDYPMYENKNFNKKIKNYIKEQEQEFKKTIENYQDEKDYDFFVNYTKEIMNNRETLHLTIFAYTGGAHHERIDNIFYYDRKNQKELQLSDILDNSKEFYETISTIARKKLKENKKELIFSGDFLEEGLEPKSENFKLLIFTKEGLKIIFPPYQVGPWSSGAIEIVIPYDEISQYLK